MSFYDGVHESFTHNGYEIQICQDDEARANPIEDDEAIEIVAWHPSYDLGTCKDFADAQDFDEFCKDNEVVRVPIFLYDHGDITVSTGPFGCPWDSGQVGWAYLTAEAIKEHGIPNPEDQLKSAVKHLNYWCTGNVWGFRILRKCGCCGEATEEVDACWGFYGDPDDENTYVREAALEACPNRSPVLAI